MQIVCRISMLIVCSLAAGTATAGEDGASAATEPFAVDWSSAADSPASVAALLPVPAGKEGFVRVDAGHLVRGDGKRLRIWGINSTAKSNLPAKDDAAKMAAHLARCGINCVRFHFLDSVSPRGLIAAGRDDSQSFDATALDRLDFFIAELKKRGVFSDLNLNVGHIWRKGDGVHDAELLGYAKALTYFDPRLIELQKQYARKLLTHRNPYTGNEYRTEPAVALVELVNENSIVEAWFSGRLLGQNQRKNPGTWTDIPASYEKELTVLYRRWLSEHGMPAGAAEAVRLKPEEFAKAPKARFRTEAGFYMDLERRYFLDMRHFLRDELGVKPPLLGTSDHNHGRSGYPLLASTSLLDVVDGHVYWQHPHYLTDPATGRTTGFRIPNTPMVNDPLHCTVVELSRSAVEGKPYVVSEVNHPFPHEYASEGVPILAAYAALHDWDGVFWYTLAHDDVATAGKRGCGHFDLAPDPVKMTQIAAGAVLFLRGDVRPALRTIGRSYGREQVIESLRMTYKDRPYFTPGFPLGLPLVHATRIATLEGTPTAAWEKPPAEPLRSDTGELTWLTANDKQGQVCIDTPRSQALVGFCKPGGPLTGNLAVRIENPFAAITLTALDDVPIARARRLLLTATGRVANTGMRWDAQRQTLVNWGTAPVCIETVHGAATLRGLDRATSVSAQPLDGAGHPTGPAISAARDADGWTLPLGRVVTTWYLVTVQ